MPPIMIIAVIMPKIMPIAIRGKLMGRLVSSTSAIALICVPQPMPNEASMANSANSTAITLPNCPAVICSSLVANSRLKVLRQTVEALFSAVPRNRNVKNQWR